MAPDDDELVDVFSARRLTTAERDALRLAQDGIARHAFVQHQRRGGFALELGLALAVAGLVVGIFVISARHANQGAPTPAPAASTPPSVSSGTPSPHASPAQPTAGPAFVVAPESCGAIIHYQDGNAGPVLCPDGKPSAAADMWARSYVPPLGILRLGAGAAVAQVKTAVCADINQFHATWVIEGSFYTLARAEQGWRFNFDYPSFQKSSGCVP